jgi:formate-dependent nitrite reductase membrane component NrfD
MGEQLAGGVLMDWFSNVLGWLMLALLVFKVFVFIDAAFRRADAYRAVDKQTKPFWLIVLGLAVAVSLFAVPGLGQMLSLIGLVAAIVYMVDVRPRIRAISPQRRGGKRLGGKKDDRSNMGPYGPW